MRRQAWALGMALLVVVVACAEADIPLAEGLNEQEATALATTLSQGGIAARIEQHGTGAAVVVPRTALSPAVRLLGQSRRRDCTLEGDAELFPSPQREAARQLALRECDLSRDVERLAGTESAQVRLSMSKGLEGRLKAAVWVLDPGRPFDQAAVRRHVSASVGGLQETDIEITLAKGPALPQETEKAKGPQSAQAPAQSPDTVTVARWLLSALLLANALSAAALLAVWHRYRRAKSTELPALDGG